MEDAALARRSYVIKAEELVALNFLPETVGQPTEVEWINRGTDQKLRPSTIDMLLRTLYRDADTPSVIKLRQSSGLRLAFRTIAERDEFASTFRKALADERESRTHFATAIFAGRGHAAEAVDALRSAGIPDTAIVQLGKASEFMDMDVPRPEGHSKFSVASAVAGSGVAGALLGVAVLAIPGVGPVAMAGVAGAAASAAIASAFSSVAAVSGVIGATGGAVARMLSDQDVDDVALNYHEQQLRRGSIFLAVDTRVAQRDVAEQVMAQAGGHKVAELASY